MWQYIRKYDLKIFHTLEVWGSNSNITSVNDLNMFYFISLMIKEDIPYLEFNIYTTLNGPNIKWNWNLPPEDPYLTLDGAKHVLWMTQYSFKNQRSMHENDENMLFWNHFKFRITFQLQFHELDICFLILFIILAKTDIKTKKNKINYFNFVLYHQIIRMAYFCVKTDFFLFFILHFMEVLYQKDWKVTTIWKRALV